MPYALSFLGGVLFVLLVQAAWFLYRATHGQVGALRTTAILIGHRVGPGTSHQHRYSPLLPGFILSRFADRDAKRCVYTKLGLSLGEVVASRSS